MIQDTDQSQNLAPPIRAFIFWAIINIRADAVYCIHVSTSNQSVNQSLSVSCSHQMPHISANMHLIQFRLGLRPRPRWEAYSAPQTRSWWEGAGCQPVPPKKKLTPFRP